MRKMIWTVIVVSSVAACGPMRDSRVAVTGNESRQTNPSPIAFEAREDFSRQRIKGDVQGGRFLQSPKQKATPEEIKMDSERMSSAKAAWDAVGTGDLAKAQQILEAYSNAYPNDLLALKDLAPIYARRGLRKDALRAYGRLVNPPAGISTTMQNDPVVLTAYGEELLAAGQASQAMAAFVEAAKNGKRQAGPDLPVLPGEAIELTDRRAAAHVVSGLSLFYSAEADGPSEAIRHLRKAVAVAPDHDVARFYLAHFLAHPMVRRFGEALPLFKGLAKSKDPVVRTIVADRLPDVEYAARQSK